MPYKIFKKDGIWHLKNQRTGQIINVPSAKSYDDAYQYGRMREAYAHGFKRTKTIVKGHNRKGTHGVRKHLRRLR